MLFNNSLICLYALKNISNGWVNWNHHKYQSCSCHLAQVISISGWWARIIFPCGWWEENWLEELNISWHATQKCGIIIIMIMIIIIQSNLDYLDLDYPDYSIIRTFSLASIFSRILITCDLENSKLLKAQ